MFLLHIDLLFSNRLVEERLDSIARPFYRLVDVLFDEQGVMLKLIRTTLVQFIRATYGSTINRQVRRFIASFVQEESIVKYFILLRDTLWPQTISIDPKPIDSDEMKRERRFQAKQRLLMNIPGMN